MSNRKNVTTAERLEQEQFDEQFKIGSSLDTFFDAVTKGTTENQVGLASEDNDVYRMDFNGLFDQSANMLNEGQIKYAMANAFPGEGRVDKTFGPSIPMNNSPQVQSPVRTASSGPKLSISTNQANALQKFPSLIEFLGREDGEVIAKKVMAEINVKLAKSIQQNSQSICKTATICVAERSNIKQFFEGDNWVCLVTASGPFRGDEHFLYNESTESAKIIRISSAEEESKQIDVTNQFNVIFEVGEKNA